MGSLKIVQVCPDYPPGVGGVEYVVQSLAQELARLGHDVLVVTLKGSSRRKQEIVSPGLRVRRYEGFSPWHSYHIPCKGFRKDLKEQLQTADVVHAHNIHSLTTLTSWRIWRRNPVSHFVVTPYYHGTGHAWHSSVAWWVYRKLVQRLVQSSAIISISQVEKRLLYEHFGCQASVIENGVDLEVKKKEWTPIGFKITYSGRVEEYKGVLRFVDIGQSLKEDHSIECSLRIIGEGSIVKRLTKRLQYSDLPFLLTGFLPREKYLEELSSSRALLLLSRHESYPQSINEAQAIGVPTVTALPWGENFSQRSRHLIVDLRDDNCVIAAAIAEFISEAERQLKSDVPSWRQVAREYVEVYER